MTNKIKKKILIVSNYIHFWQTAEFYEVLKNLILRDDKLRDNAVHDRLLDFRNEIDLLDKKIIGLLNDRQKIIEIIANFKNQHKLTIFQIERWFEILRTRKAIANNF